MRKTETLNRRLSALVAGVLVLAAGAVAEAGSFTIDGTGQTSGGRTVSAEAVFDFDATNDWLTVTLTNTEHTIEAGQLLTGFVFQFASYTGSLSLDVGTAIGRSIDRYGNYTDTTSAANLLSPATWGLTSTGTSNRIQFHPNAEYAIIGGPNSSGDYSDANGSIKNNNGHDPYAAETATFRFDFGSYDLTGDLRISEVTFLFGTDFSTQVRVVPLPPAAWMGLGLLGVLGYARLRRRRHAD